MAQPKETKAAKAGDKIKVHYTGKFKDGTVFDSSREREGFDAAVRGMEVGEQKKVEIPQEEAYGKKAKSSIVEVKKSEFPDGITPAVGQQLQTQDADGRPVNVRVTKINGDMVTLDANHPLAGKTLIFDIELMEIVA